MLPSKMFDLYIYHMYALWYIQVPFDNLFGARLYIGTLPFRVVMYMPATIVSALLALSIRSLPHVTIRAL